MALNKVFPKPTVKRVIFQLQYPNLFFLESRIPDIQIDIIKEFPVSDMIINQPLVFVPANTKQINEDDNKNIQPLIQKIWQFKSPKGYTLSITNDNFSISSTTHKTYNNSESQDKFRDIIESFVSVFEKHIKLPFVNRIGLRYTDECPLFDKKSETFNNSFNSAINTERTPIEETEEYYFKTVKNVQEYKIIYQEILKPNKSNIITFDFDGFATNIEYNNIMKTSDKLHDILSLEFENSIKKPIFDYMNGIKDGK